MNTSRKLASTCVFLAYTLAFCPLSQAQEALAAQLADGTLVKGEVVSWDEVNLSIKSALGTLIIAKDKLTPKTLEELKRWAARNKFDPQSAKREELMAKIQELDAAMASLRKDNAALRAQLAGDGGSSSAESSGEETDQKGSLGPVPGTATPAKSGKLYWVSKTGKRHNENCKYFKTGSGREGRENQGQACKICGG
jgi:septal ring factor EnvC (AmiA/AmiB activator)